jgi:hypothetical protein
MQAHRIGQTAESATTARTVLLSPDEIVLFAQDARCQIASAGDQLDHSYAQDHTLAQIEEAVDHLDVGLRMLRAIERNSAFPVSPDRPVIRRGARAGRGEHVYFPLAPRAVCSSPGVHRRGVRRPQDR